MTQLVRRVAICALMLGGVGGCISGGARTTQPAVGNPPPITYYPNGGVAPPPGVGGGGGGGAPAEAYRPGQAQQHATAFLFLPGSQNQQLVRYAVVDGQAVMDGDIMLGPATQLPLRYGLPRNGPRNVRSAVAMTDKSHLWPNSQIPFELDASVSPALAQQINGAIAHINTTSLKVRPRNPATDPDFVVFRNNGGGCSSFLGRIRGRQEIQLTEACGQGSAVHEILHAAGFYHEQSRGDRDEFVTIAFNEISPGQEDNFEKRDSRGVDIGAYDFGSIMHYSSRAFSRSGRPTIIAKVPGVTMGQREGLSTLDRAAVEELYSSTQPPPPPTPPTPPTPPNPPTDSGSFAGNYASNRGNVVCTQNGTTVNCQYPGGVLICSATGAALECGWNGGGQGRAAFQKQPNGVIAGTFGDLFSNNSRGQWTLTPQNDAPTPPTPPTPPVPPAPNTTVAPVAGNYSTTRGPMTCTENGAAVACTFQETPTLQSRLDCQKDASGLNLTCTWVTFLPPGSGRARFARRTTSERTFTGTWGHFTADSGGGPWELRGQ